jgi:murein DD-endopeptidase MepM/ murein hydrolase activator NlpD
MSDTDVIRRALGAFKDDSDKQGDRSAIRNALDDTFYAAMDGIYKLPYPERKPAPAKPKTAGAKLPSTNKGGISATGNIAPPKTTGLGWNTPLKGYDTSNLSQKFGSRPTAYSRFGLSGHDGLDWMAPEGTPVYPVQDGIVRVVGSGADYGNQIWIEHADGSQTLYAHLSDLPNLKTGDRVTRDMQIGSTGNTGNSEGPHLHLGYKPSEGAPEGFGGFSDPSSLFGAQQEPDRLYAVGDVEKGATQPGSAPPTASPSIADLLGGIQQNITDKGLPGAALEGLGWVGGILGGGAAKAGEGANWLDEQMVRATHQGQLPQGYESFTDQVADIAGQWNERIAEPVAGIAGTFLNNPAIFPYSAPQGDAYNRRFDASAAVQGDAANTLQKLQSGDFLGALESALTTFNRYGNEQFDKLDAGEQFAASILFDPINLIPGLGIGKLNKAAKIDDAGRLIGKIDNAADLLPTSRVQTPMAKRVEIVKDALNQLFKSTDNLGNADDLFARTRQFIDSGAAGQFDEIAKVYSGVKTLGGQRLSTLMQGFGKELDVIEAGYRAAQTALAGAPVAPKTLPKAYVRFLDDVKARPDQFPNLEQSLLDMTKAELHTQAQAFMAKAAKGALPIKGMNAPQNVAKRLLNEIKGAEALVYIGLSPFTFLRNLVNGITTMAIEGVNPLWDAGREVKRLQKLGQPEKAAALQRAIKFQQTMINTGDVVRGAFGEGQFATSQTGAFGSFMSRMINGTAIGKPLQWYQAMENAMRARVWTQTYWKAQQSLWVAGKAIPPMDATTEAILHQHRVSAKTVYDLIEESGPNEGLIVKNLNDLIKGKRGPAIDWDEVAATMGTTRDELMRGMDEVDVNKAKAMFAEISARVARGEDKAVVVDEVIAKAAEETAQATGTRTGQAEQVAESFVGNAEDTIDDLLARQGDLVSQWMLANDKKGAASRKIADDLAGEIEAIKREIARREGLGQKAARGRKQPPPDAPAAPTAAVPEPPPSTPPSAPPLESELPPVDIPEQVLSEGQQNARSYLLNIKQADGTPKFTEQQLATWRPETLENVAGELQTYRNTFDDIMRTARDRGVPTATDKGAPNNRRLLNVLNKHKAADAAKFATIDDVRARADEAVEILNNYVPEAKAPKVANASDANVRGIDPDEMHTTSAPRPVRNAAEAIENLRSTTVEDEAAASILSRDEMTKATARSQADVYEALLNLWNREDIRRIRLGTDAEVRLNGYVRRSVLPAAAETRQAATIQADWMDNAVMISRDGETHFDAALGVLSPFQFWRSRFALQSLRRVADKPARLAWYLKLREGQDEIQDDPRFPKRLRGMMKIPFPFAPAWAGDMYADLLEYGTSLEQVFGYNKFEDQVTDIEVAEAITALAQSGTISLTEAANAKANQSGALWEQTKTRMEELAKSTEGADSFSNMFRPHLPLDIIWKLKTGTANEIGVLFPMTRIIKNLTGVNIEKPLKEGLRKVTGAENIPDWDMWEEQRADLALADMVGDGLMTPRDALIAMIERKGDAFDQAKQRAAEKQKLQNFSVFGGQLFPTGEKEYYKSKVLQDKLINEAVASLGGNPDDYSYGEKWDLIKANGLNKRGSALGDFYKNNPAYDIRGSVYDVPEARLKDMLADEVWGAWNSKGKLDKKLMADDLGESFEGKFLDPETRDLKAVTLDELGEWAVKTRGYVPQQEILKPGDFPEVRYGTADQNQRYTNIYATRDQLFDMESLNPKLAAYSNLTQDEKYATRDVDAELDGYLDWYGAQMRANPDLSQLINPDYQASTGAYVNERDGANDVTRYAVQNLDRMIRQIGGRQGRNFGGGNPFIPNAPAGAAPQQGLSMKLLSSRAQGELKKRWANPRFFLSKDVYGELFALYRKYRQGAQSFEQWLLLFQQMVGGR